MDVVKLNHPSNAHALIAGKAVSPQPADTPTLDGQIGKQTIAGRVWTFRSPFDRLLSSCPQEMWSRPERQRGWHLVKQNGAREVWRAEIGGTVYYVKYFTRRPWLDFIKGLFRTPTCRAEWDSGIFALRNGIAAVRPVAYTETIPRGGQVHALLITEGVEPSQPLNEFWFGLSKDDDARRRRADQHQIIDRLAELIARAHQAGFEHLDMHAANLLVQAVAPRKYRVMLVDLHSARLNVPIFDAAVVRNLAQLNQWFRRHASVTDRLRFLRAYLRWRNEFEPFYKHGREIRRDFRSLVRDLSAAAEKQAAEIWSQRDRRVGRSGRYFARIRLDSGWQGHVFLRCKHEVADSPSSHRTLDGSWWASRLADPLRLVSNPANCQKNSHSAQVARLDLAHPLGDVSLIVKRPLARDWRRRLRMWMPPSRSLRGWRMGHAMLHRDLPTARPLAVLEKRIGPFVVDSLLVTERIPSAVDLATYLRREYRVRSAREWAQCKRQMIASLVFQLRRLEEHGFLHLDCKAENLLVVGDPPRLVWIDMDGVRLVRRIAPRHRMALLTRIYMSLCSSPGLTRGDFARFLRDLTTRFGSREGAWRDIWRALQPWIAAKAQAAQRRQDWKIRHYGRP